MFCTLYFNIIVKLSFILVTKLSFGLPVPFLIIDLYHVSGQVFWPVVFIATLAALIASRTMTTAIFSIIKQATALGCFPRLKIIHTSRKFMGQIYIPVMNWFLLVSCLTFVTTFGSINEIGNAYGA